MTPDLHLWLIPVLPLVGAVINGFFGKKFSRQAVAGVALSFSAAAFVKVLVRGPAVLFPGDTSYSRLWRHGFAPAAFKPTSRSISISFRW